MNMMKLEHHPGSGVPAAIIFLSPNKVPLANLLKISNDGVEDLRLMTMEASGGIY